MFFREHHFSEKINTGWTNSDIEILILIIICSSCPKISVLLQTHGKRTRKMWKSILRNSQDQSGWALAWFLSRGMGWVPPPSSPRFPRLSFALHSQQLVRPPSFVGTRRWWIFIGGRGWSKKITKWQFYYGNWHIFCLFRLPEGYLWNLFVVTQIPSSNSHQEKSHMMVTLWCFL